MSSADDNRRRGPGAWLVIGFVAGLALVALSDGELREILISLIPESIGILLTVLVVDQIYAARARKERIEALIRQAQWSVRDVAVAALDELRELGILDAFAGKTLVGVQWAGANLYEFDLRKARLIQANLQGAHLIDTDLRGATLQQSPMRGAILIEAKLQDARLVHVSLQNANLQYAILCGAEMYCDLQGTDLYGADLQGVDLLGTRFDEHTTLPNGHFWDFDTDMTRFTDPDHPNFWRSDDPKSPAYRGKPDQDDS